MLRRPVEYAQYTSEQFQRLMADHGITCSMSRSANVWDKAAMETFFSPLKTDRTARKVYRTRDNAKPTCSTIWSASTMRGAGTQRCTISAP